MPATDGDSAVPAEQYATEATTIGQTVAETPETSTLLAAIEAAGLGDALEQDGSFILLAPSNDAFAALPDGVLDALLLPENSGLLATILKHHLVNSADEASTTTMEDVLANEQLSLGDGLQASNGVVYVIDQVLVPADVDVTSLQSGN